MQERTLQVNKFRGFPRDRSVAVCAVCCPLPAASETIRSPCEFHNHLEVSPETHRRRFRVISRRRKYFFPLGKRGSSNRRWKMMVKLVETWRV